MNSIYRSLIVVGALTFTINAQAVDFNLFGDTQLVKRGNDVSFDLGAMDLSVEQNVSDASVVTADFLFETGEHGYETEIERFKISRQLNPTWNLSMGRMVSGQGFWQQTFHHGSLSQDTITPPFFLENLVRHDGLITAHATGLALEGKWGSFAMFMSISNPGAIATNGIPEAHHGFEVIDLDHGAPKNKFTSLLRLTYSPTWKSEIGLMLENKPIIELSHKDQLVAAGDTGGQTCDNLVDRSMVETGGLLFRALRGGMDYFYNGDKFYTYFEYSRIAVRDGDFLMRCFDPNLEDPFDPTQGNTSNNVLSPSDDYKASAYYLQFGYRFSPEVAITLRHESLDIGDNATLYLLTDWINQTRDVLAMSYRFDASNALRIEASKTRYPDLVSTEGLNNNELRLQWFFLVL